MEDLRQLMCSLLPLCEVGTGFGVVLFLKMASFDAK